MLFGLGLGLIVAVGVYLRAPSTASPPFDGREADAPAAPQAAAPARPTTVAPDSEPAESRFDFYEILPQIEVAVPEAAQRTIRASRPRPTETPGSFLLQVGSFSAAGDADRLQANLALLGFEAHIQRVTIDQAVFNRVRIGPIADLDAAKRAQRRLRDAGIDALLMQVPK
jgi:cell division protein FtsN